MKKFDKILLSILQKTFRAITDEMSISLTKTTRSPILCEAKDFVTGLYDAEGHMLEQTENLPILSFSLGPVCKHLSQLFADDLYPGDVIMHNDVFSLGNQSNDVAIFKPIFFEERLIGWSAAKGHQADIGGAVPGGYNPDATEVWQEALRIPAIKVFEKGKRREDVWRLIFANIRLEIVEQDLTAQIGACTLGERRLLTLIGKYGVDSFESHKLELFRSTEKMMKHEIGTIPNGVYEGTSTIYYDGREEGSVFPVHVEVRVEDENITFDLSKSAPQTKGFVNGTYTSTCSAITLTFLQMVNPDIPHNEGMIRPLNYIVPEGTILNASYPAATTFGNHLCPQVADAISKALSLAIPDRITAGWNHLLCSLLAGAHPETGKNYVDICFFGFKGGSGASKGVDGYDHIGMIDASGGVLDQDYEMYELQTPHRIIHHEYLEDSAGSGQWRGGLGVQTEIELQGDQIKMVVFGDGDKVSPYGLFGGRNAILNSIKLKYPDGGFAIPRSKDIVDNIPHGTRYYQIASGGGGYGDPRKRTQSKVVEDVQNGFCSKKLAGEDFGVVFSPGLDLEVDEEKTKILRGN